MLRRFLLLALGSFAATGCLRDDPDHCANNLGNNTCREEARGEFCSICEGANNGCVNEMPADDCYEPTDTAADTTTTTTTGATDTDTTGPTPDCVSEGLDPACPAETPFCSAGTCVGCSADAGLCGVVDPATPVCLADPAVCVGCTEASDCAEGNACDNRYECRECTEHDQCPSGACDIFEGVCFGAAAIRRINNEATNCPEEGDGIDEPFCTFQTALDSIPAEGRAVFLVQGTDTVYPAGRPISQQRTIAVIGLQEPRLGGLSFALTVTGDSVGYIDGVRFQDTTTNGVRCSAGSRTWIDDTKFLNNQIGFEASDCRRAVIRRSQFYSNDDAALFADENSRLELYASAVTGNGSIDTNSNAVRIGDADVFIVASTVAGNTSNSADGNLFCASTETPSIRNSIIGSNGGESILCPSGVFEYSAIDTQRGGLPDTVLVLGQNGAPEFNEAWFQNLAQGIANLRNPNDTPFGDVALWTLGDPRFDIDNQVRTPLPDTLEFAGADQP